MPNLDKPSGAQRDAVEKTNKGGKAERTPSGQEKSGRDSGMPSLQLPKGGGAIRGIGEKFSVNPATGTGSATIPIYTSPGRSEFYPKLSLSYNSGSGNGPFGIGWQLSLPAVTRKTDKGLPRYDDAGASDTFLISDAEDLMPMLIYQNQQWQAVENSYTTPAGAAYNIKRYRPRTEGLFARIERWQRQSDGDIHWRATTKDNVVNIYGQSAGARIADPADATRVFKWLLETSFDDKGNVIFYVYKPEDTVGTDLTAANEQNRVNGNAPFTNSYLKRILYGNQTPYVPGEDITLRKDWLLEVVLDYGEHNPAIPTPDADPARQWITRADPFSGFRSSFEVRTYRLCQRFLVFHHFPAPARGQQGYDALVRSTDLRYDQEDPTSTLMGSRIATRLISAIQTGYNWNASGNAYTTRQMPAIQFGYTQAIIDPTVYSVDPAALENAPTAVSGQGYQWIDLDGEGSPGILFEDTGGLYYKRNSSPANTTIVNGIERAAPSFGVQQRVVAQPSAVLKGGQSQFMDLAGDGHQDMVTSDNGVRGFYRREFGGQGWQGFRSFGLFPNINTRDPNVKFIDVDGDGLTDILVSEDDVLSWHRSLGEYGYGERQYARKPFDEEKGPALIFSDPTECMFLADMTGDGLSDIVRIRSGEVCYWPNRGYGRFGAKVVMDNAPCFDSSDAFDQRRIRLADIDGTGTADIVYLRDDGIALYFNQAGNSWTDEQVLTAVPAINNLADIKVTDLFGNGLACLAWSSPLPSDSGTPLHYIDLMGGQKPYLLNDIKNNLGAETRIRYVSSTKFYVQDRDMGTPWITRLAFPVYVVERMEVFDHIGRTRLVTTYRYRHGYFDGVEREFRGFGYVEQRDAESFGDSASLFLANTDTEADALHAPPVVTKTWYHTGAWPDTGNVLLQMANDYYHAPGVPQSNLLPDAAIPTDIYLGDGSRLGYAFSGEEAREALRAFKGSILRQEIYADDASLQAGLPYSVSERNYTVECFQPRAGNLYAVFFTHARETIDYHCERNPNDPRVTHNVVLEVDTYGNVLSSVSAAYARNQAGSGLPLAPALAPGTAPDLSVDPSGLVQPEQLQPLFTLVENTFIPAIDILTGAYRSPMAAEACTYELTRPQRPDESVVYSFAGLDGLVSSAVAISFETAPDLTKVQKRLVSDQRTLYLKNDLTLLPFLQSDSLGLVYETYQMAYTAALAQQLFVTDNSNPNKPADAAALNVILSGDGGYVNAFADTNWWLPSGRVLYSSVPPNPPDPFVQDAGFAAKHFYLAQAHRDPYGQYTRMTYDSFDLVLQQIVDTLGNTTLSQNDYRVLQPVLITDPNGNQTAVAFDALALVCGTAVQGKPVAGGTESGDSLTNFVADLAQADIDNFFNASNPVNISTGLLGTATNRIIYDLQSFSGSVAANPTDPTKWIPVFSATVARETHVADIPAAGQTKVQVSFSYSDGLGREIQRKIQAEPGPLDLSSPAAPVVDPRWVGSGWVILNNKDKPVRQYEPFFSAEHQFEFANKTGVTPTLFYDPLQRVVAVVHPDHSWAKTVFDPWLQKSWDGNDTSGLDPQNDPDVGEQISRLPNADYLPTWYGLRTNAAAAAAAWPDPVALQEQQDAAAKTAAHNDTPAMAFFDVLGRTFLNVAHNRIQQTGVTTDQYYPVWTRLDIEGDELAVVDALGRMVIRHDYNMMKSKCDEASMESGERWLLGDVTGAPVRIWDSRGFAQTLGYDELRRPVTLIINGGGLVNVLAGKTIYGDSKAGAPATPQQANLRTRIYQSYDSAGIVTNLATNPVTNNPQGFDFKGNLVRSARTLLQGTGYRATVDWNQAPVPGEIYTIAAWFDARNRVIQQVAPYSNQGGTMLNIEQPGYNEGNLLQTLDAWLQQGAEPSGVLAAGTATQHAITNIDYDAKGQRVEIDYGGSGAQPVPVSTAYQYDPNTLRLINLSTTRKSDGVLLQDLEYYYDPVGNITHIQDDADIQSTVYFQNKRVEPSADYTYDAIYRLIRATGREHLGQTGGVPNAPAQQSYNDWANINLPQPGDGTAMGTYIENFAYDPVGNIQNIQHLGASPASPGWSRAYSYKENSQLEPARQSNRLTSTTIGGTTETYSTGGNGYDAHGNMLDLPQLSILQWDFKDQLQMTQRQRVNATDADGVQHQGERTYYVYDASGQRVRKVTESAGGVITKERIYFGTFEVYREYGGGAVSLERQTLHVMDVKRRVALVETRTKGNDGTPAQLIRYQFSNQLDSACLELDETGTVISYEEYYPFGSTSYQAVDQGIKAAAKRYRYIGKERDEETGLYYHGARYYASWLGRWTACDPLGIADSICAYAYSRSNPINRLDEDGKFSKAVFDKFLDDTIKSEKKVVTDTTAQIADNTKKLTALTSKLTADTATQGALKAQKVTLDARRSQLKSQKHLTAAEKAELKGIPAQNNKLVKQLAAVHNAINADNKGIADLNSKIAVENRRLAAAQKHVASLTTLKSKFDTAYNNATKAHGKADVELLTDVVMNEARDNNVQAKEAIAYAYPHDTKHHGSIGALKTPKTKGPGSISFFRGAEKRFTGDTGQKEEYIGNVIDSLDSVNKRLGDPTDKNDPTQGATNWVSPVFLKKQFPPNGIPGWASSMTQITVKGVDPGDFTFLK